MSKAIMAASVKTSLGSWILVGRVLLPHGFGANLRQQARTQRQRDAGAMKLIFHTRSCGRPRLMTRPAPTGTLAFRS